jgi:hypothetical protein
MVCSKAVIDCEYLTEIRQVDFARYDTNICWLIQVVIKPDILLPDRWIIDKVEIAFLQLRGYVRGKRLLDNKTGTQKLI